MPNITGFYCCKLKSNNIVFEAKINKCQVTQKRGWENVGFAVTYLSEFGLPVCTAAYIALILTLTTYTYKTNFRDGEHIPREYQMCMTDEIHLWTRPILRLRRQTL